jgi:hypothetical protein
MVVSKQHVHMMTVADLARKANGFMTVTVHSLATISLMGRIYTRAILHGWLVLTKIEVRGNITPTQN